MSNAISDYFVALTTPDARMTCKSNEECQEFFLYAIAPIAAVVQELRVAEYISICVFLICMPRLHFCMFSFVC
jgi:hypothetical protein